MRPEEYVEAYLRDSVRALGGRAFKIAPTVKGLPDRLVILPGGRIYLVELKSRTGRLSDAQKVMHARLADLGVGVVVLSTRDEVAAWLIAGDAGEDDPS